MTTDRRRLLGQKLAANSQRRLREKYLAMLPGPIRADLESAAFLCEPDSVAIRRICCVYPEGAGYEPRVVPTGYTFREFAWPDKAIAALSTYPDSHDQEPAYLLPIGVRWSPGQTVLELSGELPAFVIRFGWARHHLPALYAASQHGVGLVTEGYGAGIVISVVVGYLPDDFNPRELIFEVGTWG